MKALFAAAALGMLTLATVWADDELDFKGIDTAEAHILPVTANSTIQARVLFLDSGNPATGLFVLGQAKGLDPTQKYFSLLYDNGSVATGPTACEPTGNTLSGPQMAVGFWQVHPDGTGTLFVLKTGPSYAKLGAFHTMSVRIVLGPPPAGFQLRSCGLVRLNKDPD